MKATIGLEHIGHRMGGVYTVSPGGFHLTGALREFGNIRRPWVARITGPDARWGFRREFVRPKTDYAHANGVGTRGIKLWFVLGPGVYEVGTFTTWTHEERYFARVDDDGSIERIARDEVDQWLSTA